MTTKKIRSTKGADILASAYQRGSLSELRARPSGCRLKSR